MSEKSHVGMMQCFFCGEPKGILLDRRLKKTLDRMQCIDKEPCDRCKDLMAQGVLVIEADEAKTTDKQNPWRTGHMWVLKDEAIERMINDECLLKQVLRARFVFIPVAVADMLGLHREEVEAMTESTGGGGAE